MLLRACMVPVESAGRGGFESIGTMMKHTSVLNLSGLVAGALSKPLYVTLVNTITSALPAARLLSFVKLSVMGDLG